jgi:hypothetical protein
MSNMTQPRTSRFIWVLLILSAAGSASGAQIVHVPADAATLTAAVAAVDDGGVIEMSGGTYAAPSGGFLLNNLGKAFTVRAAHGATVVLDGGGSRPVLRVINSSAPSGKPIVFENITFFDGLSTLNGVAGGVTVARATVSFIGCTFDQNGSDASVTGGGGVYVYGGETAFFSDCVFTDNWARNEGGGLRLDESLAYLVGCRFERNRVDLPNHRSTAAGGGIHITNATIRVANTRFEGNRAGYVGGAFYALGIWAVPYSAPRSDAVIANCTFVDNVAEPDPSVSLDVPTEGGAVHGEDQTRIRIFHSRFLTNSAENGGAVNLYRANVSVEDSVFKGNRATNTGSGTGWGGALAAISSDTEADGSSNRPSASLAIRRSFIQGRYGAVTTVGQLGGGLFASGDVNRHWGLGNVSPTASAVDTRASVTVEDTVFADCDVLEDPEAAGGTTGAGGAVNVFHSSFTMTRSLIVGSDAVGLGTTAGGIRVVYCDAEISDTTVAGSTAGYFGGGLYAQGTAIDVISCEIIDSSLSTTTLGTALFTAPVEDLYGSSVDITGSISNSIISNETSSGRLIYDDDRQPSPINDLRYVDNTLFDQSSGSTVYQDAIAGTATASQLNSLIVNRSGGASTDKGSGNIGPISAPKVAALRAAPPARLAHGATGDAPGSPEAYLAWASHGASATLDGSGVADWGWRPDDVDSFTLDVGGAQASASISVAPSPAANLAANPDSISGGSSSTLSWATSSGSFLDAAVDRGVASYAAASGSQSVAPTQTTTYRLFVVTEEGGVVETATVWVDEVPDGVIFEDGFESGDTNTWSSTAGGP